MHLRVAMLHSDNEIWELFLDIGRFKCDFMDKYADMVARTSFRILCDHSDSEYVTKEVLELFGQKKCGGAMTPSLCILRLTVELSRKRYRRNRLMSFLGRRPRLYVQTAPKVDDVDDYITTQAWEIYCRASEELSLDQRIVYVLTELEGLSEDEVMLAAGLWRGTVRFALEIARAAIRYELSKFGKLAEYEAYTDFLKKVKDAQASCSLTLNSLSLQAET